MSLEKLLDDGEPLILSNNTIDLRVLVIERDREVRALGPDILVLLARQPQDGDTRSIAAFAHVVLDRTWPIEAFAGRFDPLVPLAGMDLGPHSSIAPVIHSGTRVHEGLAT